MLYRQNEKAPVYIDPRHRFSAERPAVQQTVPTTEAQTARIAAEVDAQFELMDDLGITAEMDAGMAAEEEVIPETCLKGQRKNRGSLLRSVSGSDVPIPITAQAPGETSPLLQLCSLCKLLWLVVQVLVLVHLLLCCFTPYWKRQSS
jgi:hypothetical protein